MPNPGDRVLIEGTKLGQPRREGELLETIGSLMKIRWSDGTESLLTPGAGTIRFEKAGRRAKKAPAKRAPAKKVAKKTQKKAVASTKAGKKGGKKATRATATVKKKAKKPATKRKR